MSNEIDNKTYGDLVNAGNFPDQIEVPLDKPFIDNRGVIQNIWLAPSGSVTLITTKKGAKRASHIHKNGDWHSIYVISGSFEYHEKGKEPVVFKAGQSVFSKPEVAHKLIFIEDCVMITINNICKNHDNYESSLERVEF
jgi:quercetin dioxygenase-like cupin family protein